MDLLKAEIQSRVGQEMDGRIRDVESLRREIDATRDMIPKEDLVKRHELEQVIAIVCKNAFCTEKLNFPIGKAIQ